ncbi:leucine-rich repeat-containing protein 71 isoform 6-T6 [Theristicus caerulescens]
MRSVGRKAEQGAEEYQCTGLLEQDFPELCARAGIAGVPKVTLRPAASFPADEEPAQPTLTEVLARIERKYGRFQPCIQVEREQEEPRSVRAVFLRGWKIEEEMLGVLGQCLPALASLQAVHLWKVGLTERLLPALAALLARCPGLRTLSLEGNPLPEPAFHTLMGSDSTFNHISDLGAGCLATGLRLNRSLLSLSLVLGPFALTDAEVVERRRLLLAEVLTPKETEGQSERPSNLRGSAAPDKLPAAKFGKTPAKKKEPLQKEARQPKKPPELRAARGRDAKLSGQEKLSPEAPDPAEPPNPLLEEAREHQGSVVLPGNRALLNLNLSRNRVTERGLGAFLAALEGQRREKKPKVPGQQGLLCLSLEKNRIPPTSPALARLQELLPPQDPLAKAQGQEEEQESGA